MYVVEDGRRRDAVYCPCIAARVLPLRVAVAESTVWRLLSHCNTLTTALMFTPAAARADNGKHREVRLAMEQHRKEIIEML